jgi:deoxyribonuclease-4
MKRIGAHVSASGGVQNAPLNAKEIGAKAFALFTKNQRQWFAKPYDQKTIDEFHENMEKCNYLPEHVLPHDSYLINLGNPDKDKRQKSMNSFIDELTRCHQLGLLYLNTHPGGHLGQTSEEECLQTIADCCNTALNKTEGVSIILEITAGQGSWVGYTLEHLAAIIDKIEDKSRAGVCFDTCHAFAAGYDLRTQESCEKVFKEFEMVIGFNFLKGLHLNDAKSEHNSHVDRHHSLGQGNLGLEVFKFLMNDPRFDEIPMILETIDDSKWADEIKMLYSFIK